MTTTAATAADAHHPWPPIDTTENQIILCVGRKGSGKSHLAAELFDGWPGVDRFVLDLAGDADVPAETQTLRDLPPKMPRGHDGQPVTLRWVPDPSAATYRDDLDRAMALGLWPKDRPKLLWIDEIGEVTSANVTPPRLRRLLMQSRHHACSLIMCGPRPMDINKLCITQADRIFIFDVPDDDDRKRLAQVMGWRWQDFDAAYRELQTMPPHSFLMFTANPRDLYLCPPLPTV